MTTADHAPTRRTVLRATAFGAVPLLAGCSDQSHPESDAGSSPGSGPITDVHVTDTDLVVEIDPDAGGTELSVIDPDGEAFAERSLAAGVRRESVPVGTAYEPGTYEIRLVDADETLATTTYEIYPDLAITDLKLGRNHPEEMYEGADDLTTEAEVIITLTNTGTAPAEMTQLSFDGDVPQPTPDQFEESGIYGEDSETAVVPHDRETVVYSDSRPFSPTGGNVDCSGEPIEAEAEIRMRLRSHSDIEYEIRIEYQQSENLSCEIDILSFSEIT